MAVPVAWVATSPRDKPALDAALTQAADRWFAYRQSILDIFAAYGGASGADLVTMGYAAAVGPALASGLVNLNTHANDATVATVMSSIRNTGR